jgi:outer membrane lipoprotein-sorting protein
MRRLYVCLLLMVFAWMAPASAQTLDKAQEVLKQTEELYASMQSFQSSARATSVITMHGTQTTDIREGRLTLLKPDLYNVSWQQPGTND